MSADRYRQTLVLMNIGDKELTWYPKWLEGAGGGRGFHWFKNHWEQQRQLPLNLDLPLAYLRSIRDSGIPSWRRLQAIRALEVCHPAVLRNSFVDFDRSETTSGSCNRRKARRRRSCPRCALTMMRLLNQLFSPVPIAQRMDNSPSRTDHPD